MWWDWYKLWSHARRQDPFSLKLKSVNITGSGIGQSIENMPDIRQANDYSSGPRGVVHLRTTNDYIDLSSVQSRLARYKEYERLRNTPEIETILQIFADETCLAGHTPIATLEWGMKPINWLAENKTDERFAVYCWDFEKQDYTVGWAFDPRVVKEADTIRIKFDNGESIVTTPDHRFLMADQTWREGQSFEGGEKLMPFYRTEPNYRLSGHKKQQFPRMYSFQNGWTHERRFIDLWRTGEQTEKVRATQEFIRLLGSDVQHYKIPDITGHEWPTLVGWLGDAGFSVKEVEDLYKRPLCRRVIGVEPWKKQLVYDLSVEKHKNFATNCCIVHNCQKDDKGHVLSIECKNKKIKQELEFLFFHRDMLNIDRRLGSWAKNLFIFGDFFLELILNPNNPKDGILKAMPLPPESMFRIETTKCRVIEFQQSKEGPDLNALNRTKIEDAPEAELAQSNAIRFHPDQIVHMRIGEDRKDFYPYGVSMLEAAKSPAHQLRLMEDSMVVYRLSRAPERRVFYIDVGQLPPFKAEAFMDRMKDMYRKKKVSRNSQSGASGVEERWHSPAADEDFWIPIRPNTNTRVESLPGAQNLGEIDDAVYFRNKLYTSLQFPKNYLTQEDPGQTRITLSSQDVRFARTIERLQDPIIDGLTEVAHRHLSLRGYPEELFEDLKLDMTPPSDWRELSRAEVITNRLNNASNLKGSQLYPDYDIYVDYMKLPPEDAEEKQSRMKLQKLEDLKLQVLASNPTLLGIGQPGRGETEMGSEGGGPNPMLGPDMGGGMPPGGPPGGGMPPPMPEGGMPPTQAASDAGPPPFGGEGAPPPPDGQQGQQGPPPKKGRPLPNPEKEEIKKYDLEIQDYESEMDHEDVDYSEM